MRAPPDGYTLLFVTATNAINHTVYSNLSFNFVRDIAPVAGTIRVPFVMVVNPSVPAKTLPEFIAYAKANPSKLNMASSGTGSIPHVYGELFKAMAGVDMVHVPYRGNPFPDLLSGQVQVIFISIPPTIEFIRTDKLRALAVTTATRQEVLPDIPTVGEFVPGYEASAWQGIGAPKNTPAEIIDRLNKEINAGLADPRIKAQLTNSGGSVLALSSSDFGKLIAEEAEKWGKVSERPTSRWNNRGSLEARYSITPRPQALAAQAGGGANDLVHVDGSGCVAKPVRHPCRRWVNRYRDKPSSRSRNVGYAPESGSKAGYRHLPRRS